jgi:hypothetical protein
MTTDATSDRGQGVPAYSSLNPQIIGQGRERVACLAGANTGGYRPRVRHWVALSVIAGSETPVDDLRPPAQY